MIESWFRAVLRYCLRGQWIFRIRITEPL